MRHYANDLVSDGVETRRKIMPSCTVKMLLVDPIDVECVFWKEDNGWKGVCESLSIWVRGRSFHESKKRMGMVLKTYVRSLFGERRKAA
jgi:hypothetical protein